MKNNVFKIVIIGILACIVMFILFIVYLGYSWGVAERDTYYVTASNGEKFKMSYKLMNMPDLSCSIYLNYKGDKAAIDICGEQTSKDVEMTFLYENDNFSYYRVLHNMDNPAEIGKTVAILCKKEPISIFTDGSYVECVGEDYFYAGEFMIEALPLAEYEILTNKDMDLIMLYGDKINEDKMKMLLEECISNPEKIESKYYSKDDILSMCKKLLSSYGG